MATNQPVPRIPARQWLKEHNEAQRKQEEELMLAQERERARVIHRASDMVDAFMTKVVEEKDPWGKAEELDMGPKRSVSSEPPCWNSRTWGTSLGSATPRT